MRVEGKPELHDNVQTDALSDVALRNLWDTLFYDTYFKACASVKRTLLLISINLP